MKYWLLISAIVGCLLGMAALIGLALTTDVIADDDLPLAVGGMLMFTAATTPMLAKKEKGCCCVSRLFRSRSRPEES